MEAVRVVHKPGHPKTGRTEMKRLMTTPMERHSKCRSEEWYAKVGKELLLWEIRVAALYV
jgi:hypothetical protein